ncbi:PIG-L deacetylase family protein [Kutzneria sp. CA-103260]|uniref:PIG-L deacetylase family protein n=1 Tax=Kutzneria sp. CA-103260 TaxID=2802641 RepID=UPI001BA89AA5|nr:PIG-L deacetylase family protein [Kutzneria sp. CA-103260]QUQ65258.1 PIG-L family deacetylase [Kutzneria sp. CA-103260]
MTSPEPLQPVDESFDSVLAFVAHPDDLEYGAAAAIARWTAQGKRVVYGLATSGEAGIDGIEPEQCGPLREAEERAGAAVVGVETVEFYGFQDGVVEYGLPLRRAVAEAVRRHRPDVVLTGGFQEFWDSGQPNQADHIAVGRALMDGARDAANRWIFRDLGLEPWRAKRMLVCGSNRARHAVDVTDTFELGVASLAAHAEYLRGLVDNPMSEPREFLETFAGQVGVGLGVRYGVSFEVIDL